LAQPSSDFALLEKSSNVFSMHLQTPLRPYVLVCLIRCVIASRYPVVIATVSIRRNMLPNSRRVSWLAASANSTGRA
jgi:hypothetical protein